MIEFENIELRSKHELQGEELYQIGISTMNEGFYDTGWTLNLQKHSIQMIYVQVGAVFAPT